MPGAPTPVLITQAFGSQAASGTITTPIPNVSQIPTAPGRASYPTGFPPLCGIPAASGGINPFQQDFNGLGYDISSNIAALTGGQLYKFSATWAAANGGYALGATLQQAANPLGYWISTVNGNSNNPDTGGSGWTAGYLLPNTDVSVYGVVYDGSTDSTAAMAKAVAVGGQLTISGPVALASASLAALNAKNALQLISNTRLNFSAGGSITITGTSACNLFWSLNQQNIQIQNPVITGNGSHSGTTPTGYVWWCQANASATGAMFSNCMQGVGQINNFSGLYWIYYDNSAGTTYAFINCNVGSGIVFRSFAGNCQTAGLTSITTTATIVGYSGSDSVSYYGIMDCHVFGCTVFGQFIKNIVTFWSGCQNCSWYDCKVEGCGTDSSISNDVGSYAGLAYDHSHGAAYAPDLIYFYNNIINGVKDCGVYGASANRLYIRGHITSGQTSTANGTLPKGAIAVGGCTRVLIDDCDADNCVQGVSVVVGSGNSAVINNCTETNIVGGGQGKLLQPLGGSSGTIGSIIVDGGKVHSTSTTGGTAGIRFDSTSSLALKVLTIRNVEADVAYNGIQQFSTDSTVPALGSVTLENIEIRNHTNVGLQYQNCSNSATRASITNIKFFSPGAGSQDLAIAASTGLEIDGIKFNDRATGSTQCWYGAGAQGTVANVQFTNCATARLVSASSDLGCQLPTWSASANAYVQNLTPTVTGSGGFGTANQKHFTGGWQYDATNTDWVPDVRLTGS
jgi:hypothetical protein